MKLGKRFFFLIILVISFLCNINTSAQDFDQEIYSKRRQILMEKMGDGISVFQNSSRAVRSNDGYYYPFRTNSDFYYLSGFEDPDAAFLLIPDADKKFIMFVQPKNALSSMWFGDVPGIEGAMRIYGADTAFSLDKFPEVLQSYLQGKKKVYYDIQNDRLNKVINLPSEQTVDVTNIVYEMRVIKDAKEIELIRKAVDISCKAQIEAMKAIQPGMFEYEIAAIFSYIFEINGSHSKAYESLVATGKNSTIYHYSDVTGKAVNGDLVLMDMGAEYKNYACDITRVVPANGKFTKEQREVYEIVLAMEKTVIEKMKPGNKFFDCIRASEEVAKEGLFKLGLITDKNTTWQHYLYYFPFISHSIGLDVHDVGNFGNYFAGGRVLEPGMVFALEPLLYIGENLIDGFRLNVMQRFSVSKEEIDTFLRDVRPVFEKYKEIPARVEDDILIIENGNEILSADLPRTVEEIEKIMIQDSFLNKD